MYEIKPASAKDLNTKQDKKKKGLLIGLVVTGVIIVLVVGAVMVVGNAAPANDNGANAIEAEKNNANTNQNQPANENTNTPPPALNTNTELVTTGTVFIKGYRTPSESYGMLAAAGHEIGLGKYDSMKEQFRPYVGEEVSVSFSNVCRSSTTGCCRTLFTYCGTVDSWSPLEE